MTRPDMRQIPEPICDGNPTRLEQIGASIFYIGIPIVTCAIAGLIWWVLA